jgi:hypothetical protein
VKGPTSLSLALEDILAQQVSLEAALFLYHGWYSYAGFGDEVHGTEEHDIDIIAGPRSDNLCHGWPSMVGRCIARGVEMAVVFVFLNFGAVDMLAISRGP